MHHVYILECADGSFYVGHSTDVDSRELAHNEGRGALSTARRRPVKLVYSEHLGTLSDAVKRERQIKGWTRAKKQALIAGDVALLKRL